MKHIDQRSCVPICSYGHFSILAIRIFLFGVRRGSPRKYDKRMKNNTHSLDCQQVVRRVGSEADFNRGNSFRLQLMQERIDVFRLTKNEESARCLWIKQHVSHVRRDGIGYEDVRPEKLFVARQSAGAKPLLTICEGSWQEW